MAELQTQVMELMSMVNQNDLFKQALMSIIRDKITEKVNDALSFGMGLN